MHQLMIFGHDAGIGKAAIVLWLFLALSMSSPLLAGEAGDFQEGKDQNTIQGWTLYLKNHPKGAHVKEAREAHDLLLLQDAREKAGSPAALAVMVKRCLTPGMADQITDLWDDAVWRTAQEDGTEDAYRGYLKRFSRGRHAEEAKSGIEQAFWRECRDSGTRKPCVRYLKEYPSGTHADEAGKVLEDLEYRAVLARGTVEALEAYVKAHPERKEAFKKLRELRFARAESTGALEDWEAYYQKGRFSGWLYRRGFEGMDETANAEIERLLAERIGGDPSLDLYRDYVGRYPSGAHLDEVAEAMEPLLFDQAMSSDKPEPCLEYLERYPQDQRRNEIQDHLDPILFRKAQDEDTVAAYGEYLTKCKVCASSSKALERQAWLRDNPAGARISCPAEVEGNGSWKWETVFTETSGKTGYRVSGSGCVNDPRGGSGQWTERGTVVVKAGGKDSREYSCSSGDHELCNGYALFTWSGEDAGGHLVTLEERVKLIHTGCPGPKK